MATDTLERINQLTAERARLFGQASAGGRSGSQLMLQVREIDAELERLWAERRRERIGQLDGIDLVVEQEYTRVYGGDFEETVRPTPVAEADDRLTKAAA